MTSRWLRAWCGLVLGVLLLLFSAVAQAVTLEAPVAGAPIPVGPGVVACAAAGGWTLEAGGAQLRPPSADTADGSSVVDRLDRRAGERGDRRGSREARTGAEVGPGGRVLGVDDAGLRTCGRTAGRCPRARSVVTKQVPAELSHELG